MLLQACSLEQSSNSLQLIQTPILIFGYTKAVNDTKVAASLKQEKPTDTALS
jgi:hypothetical protein